MAGSIQISERIVPEAQASPQAAAHPTAEDLAKTDLWIFREGRREISAPAFLRELQQSIAIKSSLLDSLIQAGELEAALADSAGTGAAAAAALTDAVAMQLFNQNSAAKVDLENLAAKIAVPAAINISPPEGFTYYALHPLDFARTAKQFSKQASRFAIIGIRSIGTTLSAIALAALKSEGKSATRVTVRPNGHPYSRNTEFSVEELRWIADEIRNQAHFLVVDEGPGRSGSTFLSVAEALCRLGVPCDRLTIVGSRQFEPEALCGQNAAARWRPFRFVAAASSLSERFANWTYLGGGDWRSHFLGREDEWPESWTQMERFKAISPNRREFVKFEGMGRLGKEVRQRAFRLAQAGFSPEVSDIGDGFLSCEVVEGEPLRKKNLSADLLEKIARYCAFRASEFTCDHNPESQLEQMVVYNVEQEFGRELKFTSDEFSVQGPVIVDGRMQPHEWIDCGGKVLKADAIAHGDNHFFPGPCSIAWDLAGTVVEWDLGKNATEFLLSKFRQFSGIDIGKNLHPYLLAYCVFRLGFCKMARSTVLRTPEENRLDLAYRHYRALAAQLINNIQAA